MIASEFIAVWTGAGLLAGGALRLWTRGLLTSDRSSLLMARWMAPLLTALLFGVLAWRFGTRFDLLPYSVLATVGVGLSVIDLVEQRLPSPLVYSGLAGTGVLFASSAFLHSNTSSFLRALAGMAILAAFYLILALASRGGLGAGDVKLGALLGLALGWLGWPALITASFLGWLAAGVAWFILLATHQRPRGSLLPMGPFLLLGALLTISALPI